MQVQVLHRPLGSIAQVRLDAEEQVRAESGAMVGMTGNVSMESKMQGGFGSSLKRMFGGESFFQNIFTSNNGSGEVLLCANLPGDIVTLDVPDTGLRMQSSAYIGGHCGIDINTKVGGFKTFFAGEGIFVLEATASASGQQVILGSFGGITELQCNGQLVVDTGHLVAWDTTLDFKAGRSSGGWISSFLSGEGLVCHFSGHGRIWIQSRNTVEYGRAIGPKLLAQ